MKDLNVNGRTFQYEIFSDVSEYGETVFTEFYEGKETKTRRKYFLFGPEITKEVPHKVFTIYFDIEDTDRTKDEVRTVLERHIELLDREAQIQRGEII
jgi:hypothetical protein